MKRKMHMDLQDVLQTVIVMDGENVTQKHTNVLVKPEDHQLNLNNTVILNYSNSKKRQEELVLQIVNVTEKELVWKIKDIVQEQAEDHYMNLNVTENHSLEMKAKTNMENINVSLIVNVMVIENVMDTNSFVKEMQELNSTKNVTQSDI